MAGMVANLRGMISPSKPQTTGSGIPTSQAASTTGGSASFARGTSKPMKEGEYPRNVELEQLLDRAISSRAQLSRLLADLRSLTRLDTRMMNSQRNPSPFLRSKQSCKITAEAMEELGKTIRSDLAQREAMGETRLQAASTDPVFEAHVLEAIQVLRRLEMTFTACLDADAQRSSIIREVKSAIDLADEAEEHYRQWQMAKEDENFALYSIRKIGRDPTRRTEESQQQVRAVDRAKRAEEKLRENVELCVAQTAPLAVKCATEYVRTFYMISAAIQRELMSQRPVIRAHCANILRREQLRLRKSWQPHVLQATPEVTAGTTELRAKPPTATSVASAMRQGTTMGPAITSAPKTNQSEKTSGTSIPSTQPSVVVTPSQSMTTGQSTSGIYVQQVEAM
eukprot:CAMPEP_0184693648 /NCGR_PEP_ID=MMETSP0313-20130426/1824_1 /TAXON_ID=2792 /ORGANISM="Porphyridium aerugineum, Strain SAG 1380-2" /LENGTH=395 /DNA_ID=CAMNT_0027151785 /DNA_START=170 /DNA_END=1357 /DNA_ORIENTATION=-